MSGGEAALVGIGILCNAMQIATFGRDVLVTYKRIKDNHSPDPRLLEAASNVKELYQTMRKDVSTSPRPLEQDEQHLVDATEKCVEQVTELMKKVEKLAVPPGTSRSRQKISAITRGVAFLWRKSDLETIENSVGRYQQLVDTHLLNHISRHVKSSRQDTQEAFTELNAQVKQVLIKYETENQAIRDFMSREREAIQSSLAATSANLTTHVDRQLASTERGLQTHVSSTVQNSFNDERERQELKDRRERLLESLNFPERNARWNQVQSNHPSTFKWIFENPSSKFVPWLQSESKMFWVSGKPASGKSTLMKYIITSLETREYLQEWKPNVRLLHHFFYKPGGERQNSIESMLCSILYQLLDLDEVAMNCAMQVRGLTSKRSYHDWSRDELFGTVEQLLSQMKESFCIFFDGLDEVVEELQANNMRTLLNKLKQLDNVKICASSRPEAHLIYYFAGTEMIRIQDLTNKDIESLIDTRLSKASLSYWERRGLSETISRKAEGVFMWVILVLNSVIRGLESCESLEECLKRVDRMPSSLHELYKEMWTRSENDGVDHTMAILYFDHLIRRSSVRTESFQTVTVFELALSQASESLVVSFHGKFDTDPMVKLCQRAQQIIQLKCAGLLETTQYQSFSAAKNSQYQRLLAFANTKVSFTHRTVFDFLTDSEEGKLILKQSSLTERSCYLRSLQVTMIAVRIFELLTTADISVVRAILNFCRDNERASPKMAKVTDSMIELIVQWQAEGHFHSPVWEKRHEMQLSWPKGQRQLRLLELMDGALRHHRRFTNELIQYLPPLDFLNSLEGTFYGFEDNMLSEWELTNPTYRMYSKTLTRVVELEETAEYQSSKDEYTRILALAFSSLIRTTVSKLSLLPMADRTPLVKFVEEMTTSFGSLIHLDGCWDNAFIHTLNIDSVDGQDSWNGLLVRTDMAFAVACNDEFLRRYMAQKSFAKDSAVFSRPPECEALFKVLLIGVERRNDKEHLEQGPQSRRCWQPPTASIAGQMESILATSLLDRKVMRLRLDGLRKLYQMASDSPHETHGLDMTFWWEELFTEFSQKAYRKHPWRNSPLLNDSLHYTRSETEDDWASDISSDQQSIEAGKW